MPLRVLLIMCVLLLTSYSERTRHRFIMCPMVARRLRDWMPIPVSKPQTIATPKLHIGGGQWRLGLRDHAWRYCRGARRYHVRKPGHDCTNPCEWDSSRADGDAGSIQEKPSGLSPQAAVMWFTGTIPAPVLLDVQRRQPERENLACGATT